MELELDGSITLTGKLDKNKMNTYTVINIT